MQRVCAKKAKKLKLRPWLYDENGWPSGFSGGKLLEDKNNLENYLTFSEGAFDEKAFVSYDISGEKLERIKQDNNSKKILNVYKNTSISTVDILDKKEVISVDVVENDPRVIKLFNEHLISKFPHQEKISIIYGDETYLIQEKLMYTSVSANLFWH